MKQENETFDATLAELRALTTYASTDQTRPHMAAVCFDLERGRAAATDGHRMIVIDCYKSGDPDRMRGKRLVNARALQDALRGMGAKKTRVRVTCDLGSLAIESGVLRSIVQTVDAEFPPIDHVMPDRERPKGFETPERVGFNPCYVRDIGVIGDIQASHKQNPCCELRLGAGELDPARVDAELLGEGKVTIVVMPMRV